MARTADAAIEAMKRSASDSLFTPLAIEEWPIPQPGTGQILVRLHTCGVCGTDLIPSEPFDRVEPGVFNPICDTLTPATTPCTWPTCRLT